MCQDDLYSFLSLTMILVFLYNLWFVENVKRSRSYMPFPMWSVQAPKCAAHSGASDNGFSSCISYCLFSNMLTIKVNELNVEKLE